MEGWEEGGRRRGREEGEERKNGRRGKRGGRREEGEEGRGEEERKGGEQRQKVREREREEEEGLLCSCTHHFSINNLEPAQDPREAVGSCVHSALCVQSLAEREVDTCT